MVLSFSVSFLSTLSLRRATYNEHIAKTGTTKISIHALLAESDRAILENELHAVQISIHALLAESDTWDSANCDVTVISIHALLAESDRAGLVAPP